MPSEIVRLGGPEHAEVVRQICQDNVVDNLAALCPLIVQALGLSGLSATALGQFLAAHQIPHYSHRRVIEHREFVRSPSSLTGLQPGPVLPAKPGSPSLSAAFDAVLSAQDRRQLLYRETYRLKQRLAAIRLELQNLRPPSERKPKVKPPSTRSARRVVALPPSPPQPDPRHRVAPEHLQVAHMSSVFTMGVSNDVSA